MRTHLRTALLPWLLALALACGSPGEDGVLHAADDVTAKRPQAE